MTLNMIGAVLIAYGVINAHKALAHEHKVDVMVVKSFRFEKLITILGMLFILTGYIMEIYFLGGFGHIFTCKDAMECIQPEVVNIEGV